jgi:molybdopterin-containing oxidoreductase family iron-sulfur binding subunit
VEKCTLCSHRVARGEEPACITACLGRARHFGDLSDPESEVAKLITSRPHKQIKPEEGTNPSVYYLV